MIDTRSKVHEAGARAVYVIRCEGKIGASPCGLLLEVALNEKAICPNCGWVVPTWAAYASARTVTKTCL